MLRSRPCDRRCCAPVAAELSREDGALLLENLPLLEQFGFACEDFGGGALLVREVPADIDAADTRPLWRSLPSDCGRRRSPDEKREALLHTMACKAAIKGGWVSDPAELRVLVDQVQSGEMQVLPPRPPGGGEADEVRAGEDVQAGVADYGGAQNEAGKTVCADHPESSGFESELASGWTGDRRKLPWHSSGNAGGMTPLLDREGRLSDHTD